MGDYDRRHQGHRGGYNNRKRRYRDDDFDDRRPQRRRYEEPLHIKVRKQLLAIAESPAKRTDEEISRIAKILVENYFDVDIRTQFLDLTSVLVVEQPLKIPFLAAVVLAVNSKKPDLTQEVLEKIIPNLQIYLYRGAWREVKLVLRFLACLQGILQGDGVFPILSELFDRSVYLQTESSDDSLGLELVKVILLTIPYVMASTGNKFHEIALALLDKTDVIASTPHALEALVNVYPGTGNEDGQEPQTVVGLLQKQLQSEAEQGWKLECIPRPWSSVKEEQNEESGPDGTVEPVLHSLPPVIVPESVMSGARPRLPEIYFSVYANQEIETVPPTSDIASSIIRDSVVDTINIMDYNRNVTAKSLIDVDCYFTPDIFVKRATPFDKLRNAEGGKTTWKPEDVAVDAVFSQLMQLPSPEHKLVYYHSVLTEACKIAATAIAPSLGRAIRWLYQSLETMDLELGYRYLDWFSHHLSNFGFMWKWTEWVEDVSLPPANPKKAFIMSAIEKEIRLSFPGRIRGTLPEPYQILIPHIDEQDVPPFKYDSGQTPYSDPAKELFRMLKSKAPDADIAAGPLAAIEALAAEYGVQDPLLPSTDAYVTSICYLGSKSLSHMLSQIERCKDRLLSLGARSDAARIQIISSVMAYWADKPGVGVNVVDKLLNYTILTPSSVIQWALGPDNIGIGEPLMKTHVYEMVASTVGKVTQRVRQIVAARNAPGLAIEQAELLDDTLQKERADMKVLFQLIDDGLVGIDEGSADAVAESAAQDDGIKINLLRRWGHRWLLVFRRWKGVEEAWADESLQNADAVAAAEAAAAAVVAAPAPTVAADTKMEDIQRQNGEEAHNEALASPILVENGTSKPKARTMSQAEAAEAELANGQPIQKKAKMDLKQKEEVAEELEEALAIAA